MHLSIYLSIYLSICLCICACMYEIYTGVCAYIYICVYLCSCICMYTSLSTCYTRAGILFGTHLLTCAHTLSHLRSALRGPRVGKFNGHVLQWAMVRAPCFGYPNRPTCVTVLVPCVGNSVFSALSFEGSIQIGKRRLRLSFAVQSQLFQEPIYKS